ncbi:hypothetical protein LXL04_011354 [Taraxacum kok-saghyz]
MDIPAILSTESNISFDELAEMQCHRYLHAIELCRWQRLPLEAAVPCPMPAVNTAIWHAAGFAGSIPSSLRVRRPLGGKSECACEEKWEKIRSPLKN